MSPTKDLNKCKQCGKDGTGNFCNTCGQAYAVKRITFSTIVHEVFHFFSHLDKGILYTLKQLIIAPGKPQLEYIEGHRAKHQKPFSMFFLCATISALISYWTNLVLFKHFNVGEVENVQFFHQYMVILTVVMLPVYTLITYCFFIKSKFNYAEIFVLLLYSLSFLLLFSAILQPLKFIFLELNTEYIELPIILIYNWLTNKKFFIHEKKSLILIKTILASAVCFFLAGIMKDVLMDLIF
jgi:hypothetical protein